METVQSSPAGSRSRSPRVIEFVVDFNTSSSAALHPQSRFIAHGFTPQYAVVDATKATSEVSLSAGAITYTVLPGTLAGFPVASEDTDSFTVASATGGSCVVRFLNSPIAAFLSDPGVARESGNLSKIAAALDIAPMGAALPVAPARAPVGFASEAVGTASGAFTCSPSCYFLKLYSRAQPTRITIGPLGTAAPTATTGIYLPANTFFDIAAGPNYALQFIEASDATAAPNLEITEF